jgi:hypothetical protein
VSGLAMFQNCSKQGHLDAHANKQLALPRPMQVHWLQISLCRRCNVSDNEGTAKVNSGTWAANQLLLPGLQC